MKIKIAMRFHHIGIKMTFKKTDNAADQDAERRALSYIADGDANGTTTSENTVSYEFKHTLTL